MYGFISILPLHGGSLPPASLRAGVRSFCSSRYPEAEGWSFHAQPAGPAMAARLLPVTTKGSSAVQPLVAGELVLLADARIDNRGELRKELGLDEADLDHRVPDSYWILRAYERWGIDAPCYLLGDFAFVLWDGRTGTLLCARDHIGIRPLFYHLSPNVLALSSSLRGLLGLPHTTPRLNEHAVADFLMLIGDAESTLYEGIRRVPPAHRLIVRAGSVKVERYWEMAAAPAVAFHNDADYQECFLDLYTRAVDCRLRSIRPVGALLSGGLDSSSVACLAARQLFERNEKLQTFTAVPEPGFVAPRLSGWYADDRPSIEAMCALHANINPSYIDSAGRDSLYALEQSFEVVGAPVRNPPGRVWMEAIIEQAAKRNIGVLLHGQEGNTWVSYHGVPRLVELSCSGKWFALIRELRACARIRERKALEIAKLAVLRPLTPQPVLSIYRALRGVTNDALGHVPINPCFAKEMRVHDRYAASPEAALPRLMRDGRRFRMALAESGAVHASNDLYSAWRNGFGIEFRDPTADKRIVEFCLGIPSDQFFRDGMDRLLVRRGLRGIVPDEVLWNTCRGRQAADWFQRLSRIRGEIWEELERLERSEIARRILDLDRMRSLVQSWPSPEQASTREGTIQYMLVLERGIAMGRFIRWFESRYR